MQGLILKNAESNGDPHQRKTMGFPSLILEKRARMTP
jgi:hypothetical protein